MARKMRIKAILYLLLAVGASLFAVYSLGVGQDGGAARVDQEAVQTLEVALVRVHPFSRRLCPPHCPQQPPVATLKGYQRRAGHGTLGVLATSTGLFDERNEVYRINTDDDHPYVAYTRLAASNMLVFSAQPGTPYLCIFYAPSCTVGPGDDDQPRFLGSLPRTPRYARQELPGYIYESGGEIAEGPGSVDVLVSQQRDNTRLDIPDAVRFNTCLVLSQP